MSKVYMYMRGVSTLPADPLVAAYPRLNVGRLVGELAARLRPPAVVWAEHGIVRREDAVKVLSVGWVRQQYDEAMAAWGGRDALGLRVKAKSGVLVEDLLPIMHATVVNPTNTLAQRVAAFSVLAKMAGVDQPIETRPGFGVGGVTGGFGGAGGVAISITMDMGGSGGAMRVVAGGGGGGGDVPFVVDGGEGSEGSEGGDEFLLNPADYMVLDDGDDGDDTAC